jgi:S-DNA-T family DNA segregation ATPase FtsK/SpoIIIE
MIVTTARGRARRAARESLWLEQRQASEIRHAWYEACAHLQLGHPVQTVSGGAFAAPKIRAVSIGPPTIVTVELLPGQLPRDVELVASRLAAALGCERLRLTPFGHLGVRIELLAADPLALEGVLLPSPEPLSGLTALVGTTEAGATLAWPWRVLPHAIVQGTTGSGKSTFLYSVISQLAAQPAVLLAGCDPSGLLWRPFAGSRHDPYLVSGTGEIERHARLLTCLVEHLDKRLIDLPADSDELVTDAATPLIVTVLEEYPGLLRAADQHDPKLGRLIRSLVGRLLAEGRKVGIRVVLVAQRAEATIVGSAERAQCAFRISFASDNPDMVKLLHPSVEPDRAVEHMTAAPGIALVSLPGIPLVRVRAPFVGGYSNYTAVVRAACLHASNG